MKHASVAGPLRGSMPLRTETLPQKTLVVSSCREAVGAFDHMELCNVLLALKCRSFDTLLRGVFKPGYSGSGYSDVHGGIPISIHDHVAACTGKFEA